MPKRIDDDRNGFAQVNGADLTLVDLYFQAKAAGIFDDQQRDTWRRHRSGVNELRGHQSIEGSANAGESDGSVGLQDRGFGLRASGVGRVPARLGGRQFRLHFVKFLRADRLLVVKHLVALHGRVGQRVVGIGGRNTLVGSLHSGRSALVGGLGLRRVDRDQHLSATDVIAFMHVNAGDGSHHLAGKLRGIRRTNRAGGFHVVGNGGALGGEESDAGNRFGRGLELPALGWSTR